MEDVKALKQAGGQYKTLFWCCILALFMQFGYLIPMINLVAVVGQIAIMTIICLTLHRLGRLSTNKKWTGPTVTATVLSFVNLLVFLGAIATTSYMAVSLLQNTQFRPRPGEIPYAILPYMGLLVLLGIISAISSLVQTYMMIKMSAFVGEELSAKRLAKHTEKTRKILTFVIVAVLSMFLLMLIMSVVLPNMGPGAQPLAALIGIVFLLAFLGCIVFVIYWIVVFLGMLDMTSSTLMTEARRLIRETKRQALEEKQAAKIAEQ